MQQKQRKMSHYQFFQLALVPDVPPFSKWGWASSYLLLLELWINRTFLRETFITSCATNAKTEGDRAKKRAAAMLEAILSLNGVLADQANSVQSLPDTFPMIPNFFEHNQHKNRAKIMEILLFGSFSLLNHHFHQFSKLKFRVRLARIVPNFPDSLTTLCWRYANNLSLWYDRSFLQDLSKNAKNSDFAPFENLALSRDHISKVQPRVCIMEENPLRVRSEQKLD